MGWDDARDYFYWALTATSKENRETYFAKTFQALGQVLHLIQDVSVPAHVRNDLKSHYMSYDTHENLTSVFENQFENHVRTNLQLISTANVIRPEFSNPRVTDFWDTDQYTEQDFSATGTLGLAEFTHVNYFSDWTIWNNNPDPPYKFLKPEVNAINSRICEDYASGSTDIVKYISRKECSPLSDQRTNDHFAAVSLINDEHLVNDFNISNLRLYIDDNVNNTYAKELIPRAVGYSAALLDYFFRADIELSLSEEGVYALADRHEQGFNRIVLFARNINQSGEDMANGRIELVVRYKQALEDPFESKPVPTTEEFYYAIAPETSGIQSIPRENRVKLIFDLGPNPIPLNATDVYLQVVYHGQLGVEEEGVAVGFKDISEPTPVDYVNNMDMICINGSWQVAGSEEAIREVDTNGDGRADYDVYPHAVQDIYFKFSPAAVPQYASESNYDFFVPYILPGNYARIYILGDYEFSFSSKDTAVNLHPDDYWLHPHYDYYLTKYGITNQVNHEETKVCCEITGTPHCDTDYSNYYCCERIYSQGCDVRYYPEFSSFRGVLRWKGAMITQYMAGYPFGTECDWDLLQ